MDGEERAVAAAVGLVERKPLLADQGHRNVVIKLRRGWVAAAAVAAEKQRLLVVAERNALVVEAEQGQPEAVDVVNAEKKKGLLVATGKNKLAVQLEKEGKRTVPEPPPAAFAVVQGKKRPLFATEKKMKKLVVDAAMMMKIFLLYFSFWAFPLKSTSSRPRE
jgi:hypothetical protein